MILADDLAMADLGGDDQHHIRTPRLDRMAADGMPLTHAFSGSAVCAPSRASRLTGLYPRLLPDPRELRGATRSPKAAAGRSAHDLRTTEVAGIRAACVGKWGRGMFDTPDSPLKFGFDHVCGYNGQRHTHSYIPTYLDCDDRRFELPGNDGRGIGALYAHDFISSNVLAWVRSVRDRPLFCSTR